jgi:hypothetical protein
MNTICRNQTRLAGFGPMTCFQLYDLISWVEYMAINWVWIPEFEKSTGSVTRNGTTTYFFDRNVINAGPLMKVSLGTTAACSHC